MALWVILSSSRWVGAILHHETHPPAYLHSRTCISFAWIQIISKPTPALISKLFVKRKAENDAQLPIRIRTPPGNNVFLSQRPTTIFFSPIGLARRQLPANSNLLNKNPMSVSSWESVAGLMGAHSTKKSSILSSYIMKVDFPDWLSEFNTFISNIRDLIARSMISDLDISSHCSKCRLLRKKTTPPIMAPLPSHRLRPFTRPFSGMGIEYFGPMTITMLRRPLKRWGVILTCLTTNWAVHIELTEILSTDTFLLAFWWFSNMRGCPGVVYSDMAQI